MSVLGVLCGVSALFFSDLLRGGPWQLLGVVGMALVGMATAWGARLLLRYALFRQRLSCFSTPPTPCWLLGHLGQMRDSEEGLLDVDSLVQTYGHSCAWFLGPFYALVRVFHPDFTKPLLTAPASITVKDELFYGFLRPWLGQSLLLSNGQQWSRRRRLLTPAFHFDVLRGYMAEFTTATHTLHSKWMRLSSAGQRDVEVFHHVGLMTLDSLLRCAFSYNSDCQEASCEFTTAILELSDLIMDRRRRIHHHWDWIYWLSAQGRRFRRATQVVHSFTRRVVEKRRALIHQQSPQESLDGNAGDGNAGDGNAGDGNAGDAAPRQKRKDFIDIILLAQDEEGGGLTNKEVEAETNTFMFAGHDTTASAICWALFNLAGHAHYQDRCREEVLELTSGRAEQDIQWADLSSMPFTTMCIKESLRLHSPVLAVTRQYTRDVDLPGNRTVPKDAICLVSIYGTHHNPAVWSDPHEFNPLRFDPASVRERSPHAFIPFSSGPRNCIGQRFAMAELQVVVALTLLKFRLSLGTNPDGAGAGAGPRQSIRRLPRLVLRAEGGMWLRLEQLDSAGREGLHAASD